MECGRLVKAPRFVPLATVVEKVIPELPALLSTWGRLSSYIDLPKRLGWPASEHC